MHSSSSSEANDTNSRASSESSKSKESKKSRSNWNLANILRNVLRFSVREDFEGISYTRPIASTTCGRQQIAPKISERIVGGFEAIANSWPWVCLSQAYLI